MFLVILDVTIECHSNIQGKNPIHQAEQNAFFFFLSGFGVMVLLTYQKVWNANTKP